MLRVLLVILLAGSLRTVRASEVVLPDTITSSEVVTNQTERPSPLMFLMKKKRARNKQVIAAVLAFPLPFGIVGLHRIYLGTAPYVPVVYIATIGGVFGILPFVDFCVLVLDNNTDRYIGNQKVFMWNN